jgi:hypothetical protein
VANQLFQINFTVRIATDGNLRAAEIKHYLLNIFPPNTYQLFPGADYKLTSFIPLYDNSLISDWDLTNDEIFYLYKSADIFKGNSDVVFLPYEYQPLIYSGAAQSASKRNLLENEKYATNEINLSFITPLPVYMYFVSNVEIKEVKLGIRDILNSFYLSTVASKYTPVEIFNNYEALLSEYVISSFVTNKDIVSEDDTYLVVKSSIGVELDYTRAALFVSAGNNIYSTVNSPPEIELIAPPVQSETTHTLKLNKTLISQQLIDLFKSGDIRLDLHYFYTSK